MGRSKKHEDLQNEMVECGASAFLAHSIDWKIHFAPRGEVEANGGVCRMCRAKFASSSHGNVSVISGDRIETPAEFHEQNKHDVPNDHIGFADGHAESVIDFSYRDVEEALGELNEEPDSVRVQTAEALRRILLWVFKPGAGFSLRSALGRFVALNSGLNPDLFDGKRGGDLANEIGVSKAALSKQWHKAEEFLGFKFSRTYSNRARENCRKGQLGHAGYNTKARQKGASAGPTPPA